MMILEEIKLSTIIKAYIKYSVFQLINDVINKTFALKLYFSTFDVQYRHPIIVNVRMSV